MICRRCRGTGAHFRPVRDKEGKVLRLIHFKKRSDCGGSGSKPGPRPFTQFAQEKARRLARKNNIKFGELSAAR